MESATERSPLLLAVGSAFCAQDWRRAPVVFRMKATALAASRDWETTFPLLCRPPVTSRLFFREGGVRGTDINALRVPDSGAAYHLYQELLEIKFPGTLLLNGVEAVDGTLREVHSALGVGQAWRKGDIVATMSTIGSGIGFHAGNEDGFIIQLCGKRRWRVWGADSTSVAYRNHVLGMPVMSKSPCPPTKSPQVDVVLSAGDILYIPPLFGHDGITTEDSVSLSVGWRGFTPYTLLSAVLHGTESMNLLVWKELSRTKRIQYATLLPDPDDSNIDESWTSAMNMALDMVDARRPLRDAVQRAMQGPLVSSANSSVHRV